MTAVIAHVQPEEAASAFQWHSGFAGSDEHLLPREEDEFVWLAENQQLMCVRDEKRYLGFCYYKKDDETREWEIGGLMVDWRQRANRLGSILFYAAMGDLLVEHDPLYEGEAVITHVLDGNTKPLGLIRRLEFAHRKPVRVPPEHLPGLPVNETTGMVHGNEFEMAVPDSLNAVANWCDDWTASLVDGTPVELAFPRENQTLPLWAEGLREMGEQNRHTVFLPDTVMLGEKTFRRCVV